MQKSNLISFLFLFSLLVISNPLIAEEPAVVFRSGHPLHAEYSKIEKVLVELQRGIQIQDKYLCMKAFYPDPDKSDIDNDREITQMAHFIDLLFDNMQSRDIGQRIGKMTGTGDFQLLPRSLNFSKNSDEAWFEVGAGFVTLPSENSVLSDLPTEVVATLDEKGKELYKKYRPVTLHLKKITGFWRIVSYGDLPEALNKMERLYEANIEASSRTGKSK